MERIFIVNPTSGQGKSLEIMQYIEKKCKENKRIYFLIDVYSFLTMHCFDYSVPFLCVIYFVLFDFFMVYKTHFLLFDKLCDE